MFSAKFLQPDARMQCKDRIQVYPGVVLHFDKHQCMTDAMQCQAFCYTVDQSLISQVQGLECYFQTFVKTAVVFN